jgi:undecaprenyl pyrophosphate synthase
MENNSYYLNFLFFIFLSFSFFTIIKYFFYEQCSIPMAIERSTYRFTDFRKKNHVYFIPDTYEVLYRGKVNNFYNIYILYIKKIFEVIEALTKNNIETITIDLFNIEFLNLVGVSEIEGLFHNEKFWKFFKNFIYHQGISVKFFLNQSLFSESTRDFLTNVERKFFDPAHSHFVVNFLIGYDVFEEVSKFLHEVSGDIILKKTLPSDWGKDEIKKYFFDKATAVDLVIGCSGTFVTESLFFQSRSAPVVILNLSLPYITSDIIDTIINTELKKT